MNTFQQQIHKVSDAIARMNVLESENKKYSVSALENVDTKSEKFKTLFREVKKQITDANTPARYMSIEELSKLPHIDDVRESESS